MFVINDGRRKGGYIHCYIVEWTKVKNDCGYKRDSLYGKIIQRFAKKEDAVKALTELFGEPKDGIWRDERFNMTWYEVVVRER